MMRAVLLLLWMTLLTGIVYPLAILFVAQVALPEKANGSFISREGHVIGSSLIAQRFKSERYFWPRPSAGDYNPLMSGGSNLGPTSAELARHVASRRKYLAQTHAVSVDAPVPEDLLFASGSGLDPHIRQSAAYFQLPRIAHARGWDANRVAEVRAIIDSLVEHNPRVFPGEPGVNVLLLNLAIDQKKN